MEGTSIPPAPKMKELFLKFEPRILRVALRTLRLEDVFQVFPLQRRRTAVVATRRKHHERERCKIYRLEVGRCFTPTHEHTGARVPKTL